LHLPRHPIALARFGIPGLCPSTLLAKSLFKREPARALFTGIAAHSFLPLEAPVSSAFALVLGTAGHAVGWPIPSGGSQTIANAPAQCVAAVRSMKLPTWNAKSRAAKYPGARLCSSRNKVSSTKHALREDSTRSGLTVTCRSVARSTCPHAWKLKLSGLRPVF